MLPIDPGSSKGQIPAWYRLAVDWASNRLFARKIQCLGPSRPSFPGACCDPLPHEKCLCTFLSFVAAFVISQRRTLCLHGDYCWITGLPLLCHFDNTIDTIYRA